MDLRQKLIDSRKEYEKNQGKDILLNDIDQFLLHKLKSVQFRAKDLPLEYRMINYYDKKGILYIDQRQATGHREFNFFELLWIYVIQDLRSFGLSVKRIKNILDYIAESTWASKFDASFKINFFELAIVDCIRRYDPIYLILDDSGKIDFISDKWLMLGFEEFPQLKEKHFFLPLSKHIMGIWDIIPKKDWPQKPDWEPNAVEYIYLDNKEAQIIKDIQSGDYKKIIVNFKDRQPESYDLERDSDDKEKIINLLREGLYQDIEIKQRDGKIVHISRKIKKKL